MKNHFLLAAVAVVLAGLLLLREDSTIPGRRIGTRTEAPPRPDSVVEDSRSGPAANPAKARPEGESGFVAERQAEFPGTASSFEMRAEEIGSPALEAEFGAAYSDGLLIRHGAVSLRQRLIAGAPSPVQQEGMSVVYRDVWPGVDAILRRDSNHAEEFLKIAPGAASELMYEFRIESEGAAFRMNERLEVVDANGSPHLKLGEILYECRNEAEWNRAETSLRITADARTAQLTISIPLPDRGSEILLDPGWFVTGSLNNTDSTGVLYLGREFHTSTLLSNGSVLVTGGETGLASCLNTCDVYNPATGTWTLKDNSKNANKNRSMLLPRSGHSATLLSNGRLLVAGGYSKTRTTSGNTATCELYDPVTDQWSFTGSMAVARRGDPALLLPNGRVLALGDASCEIYNPATGTWNSTGSMLHRRAYGFTATLLLNGTVLVTGGSYDSAWSAPCELYHPATGTWSVTAPMPEVRLGHAATLLSNGRVLVAGGQRYPDYYCNPATYLYDPSTQTWSTTGSLHQARVDSALTSLNNGGALICAGHGPSTSAAILNGEVYDAMSGSWTVTNATAERLHGHTLTRLSDGSILSVGGWRKGKGATPVCEVYKP